MTLATMTAAEKSRWIAEKLEPEPDYRPVITSTISGIQNSTDRPAQTLVWKNSTDRPAQTLAWRYVFRMESLPSREDHGEWQPRDMVNDPAMTMMLHTHLLKAGFHAVTWPQEDYAKTGRVKCTVADGFGMLIRTAGTWQEAVVDAFMLASGFKEE